MAVIGVSTVVIAACCWPPDVVLPALAPLLALAGRAWAYAASIVLEAAPYILVGSLVATLALRAGANRIAAALLPMVAPGCDCSMNGYAPLIARAPAPLAAFSMIWSASCNPIALFATHAILGAAVFKARIAGTLVAGCLTALGWSNARLRPAPSACGAGCRAGRPRAPRSAVEIFGSGLLALVPAATLCGVALVAAPHVLRAHAAPLPAAALGALISPCSTADAILARVLAPLPAAQAAFVMAAQTLDARQLSLLARTFGMRRAAIAAAASLIGCAVAVFSVRHP